MDLLRRLDESAPQAIAGMAVVSFSVVVRRIWAYRARQRWRSAKRAVPPALGRLKKVGATLALYNFRTQWLTSAVSEIPSLAATLIADGVSDQDEVDLFRAVPSSQAAAGSRCWR